MSRMIFAFCVLTIVSGCYCTSIPRRVSLVKAHVDTSFPPVLVRFGGQNSECQDCIPHRPYTCDYFPWWDYHLTQFAGQCCALRAYSNYRNECGRPLSYHFKCGFISAYEDLALNRRPSPPIVPPPKYWNAYYRSPAGQPFVDDWFAGYDAGLESGLGSGVSRFQEVYLRRSGCIANPANRFDDGQSAQIDSVQPQLSPAPAMPMQSPTVYGQPQSVYGSRGQ